MKLQPKFKISEESKSFVVITNVPGMKLDDIKLQLADDNSTITIEGFV